MEMNLKKKLYFSERCTVLEKTTESDKISKMDFETENDDCFFNWCLNDDDY